MWSEGYLPAGGMPSTPWGREMDYNLVHQPDVTPPKPAARLAEQSQRDAHSVIADAMFVDATAGDFRVKEGSPALQLGFVNFPMDQFGVQKPKLKAVARTPQMPGLAVPAAVAGDKRMPNRPHYVWQAQVRNIAGLGERSAYGLPGEFGVLLEKVPGGSPAAKAGLAKDDVIAACNGKPVRTWEDLREIEDQAAGKALTISVVRKQQSLSAEVGDYVFAVTEYQSSPDFKTIPLNRVGAVLPVSITASEPGTENDPLSVLSDGKLAKSYGPVFGNGVVAGRYKLDLGTQKSIVQVNTFSFNKNFNRGRQRFVLYGSSAISDPGWNVEDARVFCPILDLETKKTPETDFIATSIRQSGSKSLGSYRWLVWTAYPISAMAGGENTAFQEFQVIAELPSVPSSK